jgi:hypothetical protein
MASTLISLSSLALPLGCLHFIRSVSLTLDAVLLANDIGSSDASFAPSRYQIGFADQVGAHDGAGGCFSVSISALQVVSPCRPPIRHNSKMLHFAGSVARGLAGESTMPCEALCTPQLHGIVAVRPSRLGLQYCLEVANLLPVSAPVEAKSTQVPTSF